jgi:hypothetical protein
MDKRRKFTIKQELIGGESDDGGETNHSHEYVSLFT